MDAILASPVMIVAMVGMVGFVLAPAGWHRPVPGPDRARWADPATWKFLVLEFVGSTLSDYASYLAVLLLGAALGAVELEMFSETTGFRDVSRPPEHAREGLDTPQP